MADDVISSFGYAHGAPPSTATVVIDVRLRVEPMPADDAHLWELAGRDPRISARVLAEPGVDYLLSCLLDLVDAMHVHGVPLHVAVGGQEGRHRAPVLAEQLAALLRGMTFVHDDIAVAHRDIDRPPIALSAPLPHVRSLDCWCSPVLTRPVLTRLADVASDPGRVTHHGVTDATVWLTEGEAIGRGLLTGRRTGSPAGGRS